MVWMMRGHAKPAQGDGADASIREEIAVLRAELAALRRPQTDPAADQPLVR